MANDNLQDNDLDADGTPAETAINKVPLGLEGYLVHLANGRMPSNAQRWAFPTTPPSQVSSLLSRARDADPEFRALEDVYINRVLMGNRPALAKALLAHQTLPSVQRLIVERDTAKESKDRIRAAEGILDRGPLAPKLQAQSQAQQIILHIHSGGPLASPHVVAVEAPKPQEDGGGP